MINLNKTFIFFPNKNFIDKFNTCSRFPNCLVSNGIMLDHMSDAYVEFARATA